MHIRWAYLIWICVSGSPAAAFFIPAGSPPSPRLKSIPSASPLCCPPVRQPWGRVGLAAAISTTNASASTESAAELSVVLSRRRTRVRGEERSNRLSLVDGEHRLRCRHVGQSIDCEEGERIETAAAATAKSSANRGRTKQKRRKKGRKGDGAVVRSVVPSSHGRPKGSNHRLGTGRDEALRDLMVMGGLVMALSSVPEEAQARPDSLSSSSASTLVKASSPGVSVNTDEIFRKATRKALGGGASGAAASVLQIASLMWLRTIMNFQYRYGGTLSGAAQTLWSEGGIPRFYKGVSFALIQTPLARFGDTASIALVLALLDASETTRSLPLPVKTVLGSVGAGWWRLLLFPLDTLKTSLQVQGQQGLSQVKERLASEGVASLYRGAIAQALATFVSLLLRPKDKVGHYPYFLVFNYLSSALPPPNNAFLLSKLVRNAFMGLCSATVSDCCSNSLRVLKTTVQTSEKQIGYQEALKMVLETDGIQGLLGRGLKTRLLTNGLQGMLFAVAWKYFESIINAGT